MAKVRNFLSILLFSAALGLEVAPNSPCAKRCMDDPDKGDPADVQASLTFHRDLSCHDWQYKGNNATDVGKKFADCQTCLRESGYEDEKSGERDSGWFQFNNRGTVDWCLFGRFAEENGTDNVTKTYPYKQCNSDCKAIYNQADYKVKSDPSGYNYCDYNGNFTSDADPCISCLYDAAGLTVLGNVLTTLKEFCITKPGKVIDFDADIYNASRISLNNTSARPSPSSSASTSPSPTNSSSSGLSKGALAGIVLGALVGIALILAGILLLLRRLRSRSKIIPMLKGSEADRSEVPNTAYAGNYTYDPVLQQRKDVYMYGAPVGALVQPVPVELGAQSTPVELGTSSPMARP